MEKAKKRVAFVSLRLKLLVGFTLLFSVVFAVAFYWFYSFATDLALIRIRDDLAGTLQAAAGGIDGDAMKGLYSEAVPGEDGLTEDPRFWAQAEWLNTVHTVEPRAWLYTYMMGDKPGEIIFVSSHGALEDPPAGVAYLEHWETDNPGPNRGGMSEITLQDDQDGCTYLAEGCKLAPYSDDWGSWVSGFAPIKNSAGESVAAVGIDFEADYVSEVQQAILDQVLVAFAITYVSLFILVYIMSGLVTQPIIALTKAAERIGEGNYDQDLSEMTNNRFPDEIDSLTKVFDVMVDKVREREQKLRQQVEELRIEIDVAKRQKQVSEIVESTFFGDLQAQAQRMRKRRRKEGDEDQDQSEQEQ